MMSATHNRDSLWVVLMYVDGAFKETVCISAEVVVAISIATEGNLKARLAKVPVRFEVEETLTDYAFKKIQPQSN